MTTLPGHLQGNLSSPVNTDIKLYLPEFDKRCIEKIQNTVKISPSKAFF